MRSCWDGGRQAASLRSPSQSVRNPINRFQLGIIGDARPEIRNGLAYAAKLHGVLVHAACLMSTHSHEVITDVRGEYPKFLQTFHRYLALWN
jgi:hypothetical protein